MFALAIPRRVFAAGLLAACCAILTTGCVGPMACGPTGCDSHGPIVLNQCGGCESCNGCGELYLDPWINHPADACDPCDRCGNYNGQSCGKCRSVFDGAKSLWGYRCGDECGGCDSCEIPCGNGAMFVGGECGCGVESCGGCDGCDSGHGYMMDHASPTLEPTVDAPSASATNQAALVQPYRPSRKRQIFRSREAGSRDLPISGTY